MTWLDRLLTILSARLVNHERLYRTVLWLHINIPIRLLYKRSAFINGKYPNEK